MKQTWLARRLAVSLRFTRRCVSKLRGNPFAKGAEWDWHEPVVMGFALIAGSVAGGWPSLLHSPVMAIFVLAASVFGANLILLGARRRRRDTLAGWARAGCCTHCGYPRRGNVSGICPECGVAVRADPTPPVFAPVPVFAPYVGVWHSSRAKRRSSSPPAYAVAYQGREGA